MTTVLCTLYNTLYLDKGLVLYDSLCESAKDFKLYVLCMDDRCYEVLSNLNYKYHIPVKLSDFEYGDNELLEAKVNRPTGEYCWTCTSSFIRYVLNHYHEPICTYIDADMFFYNDPQVLVDEMLSAGKSVMLTPHRFPKEDMKKASKVGKYCVEFNTFLNNDKGIEVLEYWRNKCIECCGNIGDGVHWGDQKYLDELEARFNCIHICENNGAGVAPWNIMLYSSSSSDNACSLLYKEESKLIYLIFYHFQGIQYVNMNKISTGIPAKQKNIDYELVNKLYKKYLVRIDEKKQYLDKEYNITLMIKTHPSVNLSKIRRIFHKTWMYKSLRWLIQLKNHTSPYIIKL